MLCINVSINLKRDIEDIWVHNTGYLREDEHIYELIDPGTNNRLTETMIFHRQKDGYRPLLIKVLKLLEDEKIPEKILF